MLIQNEDIKILFIEDEVDILSNYTTYLQRRYKYIETATDGIEAYNKYQTFQPNLIFLDVNIPKLDGLEILKRIREKDSTTMIIMISAHSEEKIINKAKEYGVDRYILKPVTREELRDCLESVKAQGINSDSIDTKEC